jgi:GAF domain/PilZ domain/Sel1 repeat
MEFTGPKPSGTSRQSQPVTERRQSERLVVHSPAYARLNGASEKARDLSEILNISEDGVSIQTSSPLEVDHNLNLCLDLSETKARITTTGRVVWANKSGRAGIRFPRLTGQSLRQLKEWLFVNVLTAFEHARGRPLPAYADGSQSASGGSFRSGDLTQRSRNEGQRNESASRAPEPALESLVEPGAISSAIPGSIQREVEAGGYSGEAVLQLIAERALTSTRATGAAIALSVGDEMICQASVGFDAPPLGSRLQSSSGFSGECVRTGRSLRCDDSEADDRVDRAGCRVLGVRSIVAVPIRAGSRVAGLVEVFSSQPYAFGAKDISVLQQLANAITSAISGGQGVPAAPPELPKAAPSRLQPPRTQPFRTDLSRPEFSRTELFRTDPARTDPGRTEDRRSSEVMAGTVAAVGASPRPRLQKILLPAAALTFLFAVSWLIAPWVSNRVSMARTRSQVTAPPTAAKPVSLPAEVNDLAGLRKLAEQGDPAAQFALGARYATGEEVQQDYSEAVRWFARAADQGHILAQATLGAYYWAGRGVPPDLTKAYFWSALAQAGGDQASKYRVAVLTSRMSRSEILAAQQQANDWLHNHQTAGNASASQ